MKKETPAYKRGPLEVVPPHGIYCGHEVQARLDGAAKSDTTREIVARTDEETANLFALAPELLRACELIYTDMGNRIGPAAFNEFSDDAKSAISRAISKAHGAGLLPNAYKIFDRK